jgi:hypothetical protein
MIGVRVRPGRPVIVAAVAATALVSGAGVALATSSSPSVPPAASTAAARVVTPSPAAARCEIKLPLRGFLPPGRFFAITGPPVLSGLGLFGAIHGQFVTSKPGGGYQTIDIQRGTVTAVGSSSITVKSRDGYTTTYQVTSSTSVDGRRAGIGSVKTGQAVSVLATVDGTSVTATQIADFPALPLSPRMLRIGLCPSPNIGR